MTGNPGEGRSRLWSDELDAMRAEAGTSADERDLALVRRVCLRFPDAEEAELQGRPLFRVQSRRFALFNGRQSPPRPRWAGFGRSLHVVTDPVDREALLQDPRFTVSPHHGDRGWLAIDLEQDGVDWDEIAELLEAAYRHVAGRRRVGLLDGRNSRAPVRAPKPE